MILNNSNILLFAFLSIIFFSPVGSANPFLSGKPQNNQVTEQPAKQKSIINDVKQGVFTRLAEKQQEIYFKISDKLKQYKKNETIAAFAAILLISFLYGVLHAAGPGHGKTLASSYFLSQKERAAKAVLLGLLIALLHSGSSVVIVLVLLFLLNTFTLMVFDDVSHYAQLIGFSLIIAVGIFIFIKAIHEIYVSRHDNSEPDSKRLGFWGVVLAVGIIPCPGAMTILIFTNSMDIIYTGVAMIFAMSLGMAVTISSVSLVSVLIRKTAVSTAKTVSSSNKVFSIIEIMGAILIISIGAFFLIGILNS